MFNDNIFKDKGIINAQSRKVMGPRRTQDVAFTIDEAISTAIQRGYHNILKFKAKHRAQFNDLISALAAKEPDYELEGLQINMAMANFHLALSSQDRDERLAEVIDAVQEAQEEIFIDEAQSKLDAAWDPELSLDRRNRAFDMAR